MPRMDINILIHKSLTGQISSDEQERLNDWLTSGSSNQEIYDEIKLIWENADADQEAVSEQQFAEELQKLETAVGASEKKDALIKTSRRNSRALAILSAIITLALVAVVFWPVKEQSPAQPVKFSNSRFDQVVLQDGSLVVLNDSSSLEYSQGKDDRLVSLRGEAFFDVTPEERPFKVSAAEVNVEVLGTSFVVKAYPGQPTEVFVVRGKVKVRANGQDVGQGVEVTAGEKATFGTEKIEKSINDNPNFDAWYSGMLEFRNTPLGEVLRELETQYDVGFSVDQPGILPCRFTGKFENASLDEVLRALSFSMNLTFRRKGQTLFAVSGEGCIP